MKLFLKYSSLFAALQMSTAAGFAIAGAHVPAFVAPSVGFVAFVTSFLLLLVTSDYPSAEPAYHVEMSRQLQAHLRKAPHALAA